MRDAVEGLSAAPLSAASKAGIPCIEYGAGSDRSASVTPTGSTCLRFGYQLPCRSFHMHWSTVMDRPVASFHAVPTQTFLDQAKPRLYSPASPMTTS